MVDIRCFYLANTVLVCISSDIEFEVIMCIYCVWDGCLGGSATDRCEILHDGRYGFETGLLP